MCTKHLPRARKYFPRSVSTLCPAANTLLTADISIDIWIDEVNLCLVLTNITEYILSLVTGFLLPLPSYRLCISQGASTLNPMTAWAQIGLPLFYPRCSSTVINSFFKFQSRQGFNPSGIGFGCESHSSPPSNCSWEIIPHQYGSSELSNVLEISITWALRAWLAGEIAFPLHEFNAEKRLCWFKRMTPWMQKKKKMKQGILNSK